MRLKRIGAVLRRKGAPLHPSSYSRGERILLALHRLDPVLEERAQENGYRDGYYDAHVAERQLVGRRMAAWDEYERGIRRVLHDPDTWIPYLGGPRDGEAVQPDTCYCERCTLSGRPCLTWPAFVREADGEYALSLVWRESDGA